MHEMDIARVEMITCRSTSLELAASQLLQPSSPPSKSLPVDRSYDGRLDNISAQELGLDVCDTGASTSDITQTLGEKNSPRTMGAQFPANASGQSTIDGASCQATMCSPTSEQPIDAEQVKRLASEREARIYRMIHAPIVIIDNTVAAQDNEHAVLSKFRRNPHNIVLDSLRPDLAPHIVITPAYERWDEASILEGNRAGPQRMPSLTVPPFYGSTCRMHTYEEYQSMFFFQYPQPSPHVDHVSQDGDDAELGEALPETSTAPRKRQFHALSSDVWADFLINMTHYLVIRAHKIAANEACLKAPTFRTRYEMAGFLESIERPFEWVDPAKGIYEEYNYRCPRNSILIESDCPFTVPHIIIHCAPTEPDDDDQGPQDTDLLYFTQPPRQKNQFGTYFDDECFSDYSSDADSTGPRTPTSMQRVGSGFFRALVGEGGDDDDESSFAEPGYLDYAVHLLPEEDEEDQVDENYSYLDTGYRTSKFFIPSDDEMDEYSDDEDSLPDMDTDEWFIEARARSASSSTLSF